MNTTVKEEASNWNIDEVKVREMFCPFVYVVTVKEDRVLLIADLVILHNQ